MRRILALYWYPDLTLRCAAPSQRTFECSAPELMASFTTMRFCTTWLLRTRFDGVVLHNTFLGVCWNHDFEVYRKAFEWLPERGATTVAIPQDEYDHSEVLDEWLAEMHVPRRC